MRGVRVILLCGAVILLVTACEQANQAKGAVMKVVQRFRGTDTTHADTTKQVATASVPAMDTTAATTGAKTATKGAPPSTQPTRTAAGTKTASKQPATGTTAATQQSKTAGAPMTTASKTTGTQPRTTPSMAKPSSAPVTTRTSQPSAPSTAVATQPVTARPAANGPRPLTDAEKEALDDLGSQYAMEFELHPGWFRDHSVAYYDFGPTPQPIVPGRVIWPIYGFDSKGSPVAIRGQRPIFSGVPGIGAYSGFWRLSYLVVADHVTPNELRDETSADMMVRRHRAFLRPADVVLNLPIVPRGSRLAGDSSQPSYGWFQGREVQYFDFGAGSQAPVPLFAFTTGTDANGDPIFLRTQSNVVDTLPVRAPFPDLWAIQFVRVDSTYRPNTWRNANAVVGGGAKIESSHSWRNCPVVIVDNARVARQGSPLRVYADDRSPLPPSPTIVP
jgi:hypothetical protein